MIAERLGPIDLEDFRDRRCLCSVGAAIIGAVGAIGGGAISAYGAKSAADAQKDAAMAGINAQMNMYNANRENLLPYITAGNNMLPALQGWNSPTDASSPLASLLKLTTPGADMSAALAQTPGYQFTQQMGQKAVNNALAARGLAGPGGALSRASADYASGLASSTWQNVVNSLLSTYQAGATGMQNVANMGAQAGGALAGVGAQTGNSVAQGYVGMGNAQAAGTLGMTNALSGMFNNAGSQYLNYSMLSKLGGGGSNSLYSNPSMGYYGSNYSSPYYGPMNAMG